MTRKILVILALPLAGCWLKESDFFSTGNALLDVTAPEILLLSPVNTPGGVFNLGGVTIQARDLIGENGAPPTEVDWSTFRVLRGGMPLTYTVANDQALVDFGTSADGGFNLDVSVKDHQGNLGTQHINSMDLDRTSPNIVITSSPTVTQLTGLSATLNYSWTVADAHLLNVNAALQHPGNDGSCGGVGATPFSVGSSTGQVSQSSWSNLSASNGSYQIQYSENTPAGASSVTEKHCLVITASDAAKGANLQPNPNTTTLLSSTTLMWIPPAPVDNTPVEFINVAPLSTLSGPFNISSAAFDANDPQGSNAATPTGVDPSSIQVLLGQNPLPFTRNGNRYTVSLTGIADGPLVLNLSGKDFAGNTGSGTFGFDLARTPPNITLQSSVAGNWSSPNPSEAFNYSGTVTDEFPLTANGALYRGNPDGTCVADQAHRFTVGTGPGNVSQDTWSSYLLGPGGSFSTGFTGYSPALAGGSPVTERYCFFVYAADYATDATGAPNPNSTSKLFLSTVNWQPSSPGDFTFALNSTGWAHIAFGGGLSFVCTSGHATSQGIVVAGAPYTITWTTSGGAFAGTTTRTGNLDSQGNFLDRQGINAFGTYNVSASVTAGGVTKTATGSVVVTGAAGSCTAP